MASPCEILLRSLDHDFCKKIAKIATQETVRIEDKFSRYIKDNLVDQMNKSFGLPVEIDDETYQLLEYARQLYDLSDGMFDITSGVLRKLWTYANTSRPPSDQQILSLIEYIGFNKIDYKRTSFTMPKEMEIDFGGIGKEYAVDQVCNKIRKICQHENCGFLVNFGGDIAAESFSSKDPEWIVGVEETHNRKTKLNRDHSVIRIKHGCVATSGNSKRFIQFKGKRYGHLLNPKTGYPIEGAPMSITAFANSCVLAGSFSSLAMLHGAQAESFLQEQNVDYICNW